MNTKLLATVAAILLISTTGCPAEPGLTRETLVHDGVERTYWLSTPPGEANEPLPLVVTLHGGAGTGAKMVGLTKYHTLGRQEGFLAAFPDGLDRRWNDGRESHVTTDDVGFLTALIDHLIDTGRADPDRVYVTGASNGGMMTYRLACEIPEKLAAIAPVMSSIPEALEPMCDATTPVPILIMNGEEDPLVPWAGGEIRVGRQNRGRVTSTPDTVDYWVERNGCNKDPEITMLPDTAPDDGTKIRVERHAGDGERPEVVLYAVEGGGHTWPGGRQYLPEFVIGRTSQDIDASKTIWEFFSQHSR